MFLDNISVGYQTLKFMFCSILGSSPDFQDKIKVGMKGVWVKSLCIYSDAGFCSYLAALMSVVVSNVKPLHTHVGQALRNAKTFKYVKYALRTRTSKPQC